MKALVFNGTLHFSDTYPTPRLKKDEALIKISMAGICSTDLEILKGYRSFRGVPGHEFVGIVEKVNGGNQKLVGKRVVGEINCGCGTCDYCRRGLENHCPHRTVIGIEGRNGVFAEYVALPVKNLHNIPDTMSDEEAVFVEPLAAAFEILEQVQIKSDDRILVLGDGKLGILCGLVLGTKDARVLVAGKHSDKLDSVKKQGIESVIIDTLPARKEYDIVVEATGSPHGLQNALQFVKPRGTLIMKTTVARSTPMNLSSIVVDEIHVVGSRCGPFVPALKALVNRKIDVRPLITEIIPFSRWRRAVVRARDRNSLKIIMDMRGAGLNKRL